ncbi:YehQ protein product [Escherichia coli H605]|uniref:YehQ protein product n=1 Tax=Escherichia coli H605 TaxID=656410 RepID=A0AAJ3NYB3_ECOLX|nr:YehQ protein product [Escherichia coli H605]
MLANELTVIGFYRLAHVLKQLRNSESETLAEVLNNCVLLCEQLLLMLEQQGGKNAFY